MSEQKIPYKIYLSENEIPEAWYNVRADMKVKPAPLLNPGTGQPMTAEELGAVFCDELVAQELESLCVPLTDNFSIYVIIKHVYQLPRIAVRSIRILSCVIIIFHQSADAVLERGEYLNISASGDAADYAVCSTYCCSGAVSLIDVEFKRACLPGLAVVS